MTEDTAVIVEEPGLTVSEENGRDLDGFKHDDYLQYIPQDLKEELNHAFVTERYGWKSRARSLMKIHELTEHIEALKDSLSFEKRVRGPRKIAPRDGLRAYFESRTDEQLRRACSLFNVDYSHLISDRNVMIDTLCSEAPVNI